MAKKHKLGRLVNEQNLDFWLCSTGFLYPRNEKELDVFEKLYENFELKLVNVSIDMNKIISGNLKNKGKIVSFVQDYNEEEINGLKMVARKGKDEIPKEILEKMKKKHTNGD